MTTVPEPALDDSGRSHARAWTDSTSMWFIFFFLVLVYIVFFHPILRYDGIHYMAAARSLIIDGNLNTYDEGAYFIQPGWNDVSIRKITGSRSRLISYVSAPDYTPRGYRYVVFPIGNSLTWALPLGICHFLYSQVDSHYQMPSADGFSAPYRIALGWWSFLIGAAGLIVAYRILRNWFNPQISCASVMFVFASGNLIQFMTRDVTFSHSIDFLLINLNILMFLTLSRPTFSGPASRHYNVIFGALAGYSIIVRYQDVALLLFPMWFYLIHNKGFFRIRWKDLSLFLSGFLLVCGLQLVYWKILFGSFLISGQLMGTGNLASFSPMRPQLIPMLFSRFHGLFNWMPWLLPITLCYALFVRRSKQFGSILLLIIVLQAYYISSRSEWWNMGFSVRRFSGFSLFFMLGAAEIVSVCKHRLVVIAEWFMGLFIVLWSWLFQISYFTKSLRGSVYPGLIENSSPFFNATYQPIIPSLHLIWDALIHSEQFFRQYSLIYQIFKPNGPGGFISGLLLISHLAFLFFLFFWVFRLNSGKFWQKPARTTGVIVIILSIYILMIVSDLQSEPIIAHRLAHKESDNSLQLIRVPEKEKFLGENAFIQLSSQPVRFKHPDSLKAISGNWLIGCKPDHEPVILYLELQRDKAIVAMKKIELKRDQTDDIQHLDSPWGDVDDSYEWVIVRTGFPDSIDVPDEWIISKIQGQDCVIGAFWHPLD